MGIETLAGFNLAGGTALSLQLGHRTSTDLDFFGIPKLHFDIIKSEISANFHYQVELNTKNILIGFIDGVKVDFVNYKYRLLKPPMIDDGIRFLSIQDIACMKLAAVTGRGKKRDFIDLYFILKIIPLNELLKLYENKYQDGSIQLVLKSLTYFNDAEQDEMPFMFSEVGWGEVKRYIQFIFRDYYKTL